MEFKIEGILETLLVGSMVSLLLVSIGFFLFGHIWNVPVIRKLLDVLFSERVPKGASESHNLETEHHQRHSSQEPVNGQGRATAEEKPLNFVLIVLLAILYGLGVIAESYAHQNQGPHDDDVKRTSFKIVARGQLKSGTAPDGVAPFISDYDACNALLARDGRDDAPSFLCQEMDDRVLEFYHNAKNAVLQVATYNDELIGLEGRINFIRSFSELSRWLFRELLLVLVIALFAEVMHLWYPGSWQPVSAFLHRWDRKSHVKAFATWADNLARHWVKVSAFRCALLFVASIALHHFAQIAAERCEDQFDKKIFGYYLALLDHSSATKGDEPVESAASHVQRNVLPRSPYHVFSLPNRVAQLKQMGPSMPPGAGGEEERAHRIEQRRLEPSAVQILGHSSHVLVANHKGDQEPFWLFTLNNDSTQLDAPQIVEVPALDGMSEIKSIYAADDTSCGKDSDGHEITRIVAAGTFAEDGGDGGAPANGKTTEPKGEKLVTFCLDADDDSPTAIAYRELKVPPLCERDKDETAPCIVVGIASGGRPDRLVLAVQRLTQNSAVTLVAVSYRGNNLSDVKSWLPQKPIYRFDPKTLEGMIRPRAATTKKDSEDQPTISISDLAIGPNGTIYVTTSIELKHELSKKASSNAAKTSETSQVEGALWTLDRCDPFSPNDDCRGSKPRLIETFVHKSEGVSCLDDGSLLVVFDDEAWRKSREWAPRTFAISQNESVFALVPAPGPPPLER
jgi:hypothetical protein